MNQLWQSPKPKNRQWRIIIWSSLFLIFGKDLAIFTYHALAIDQAYTATTNFAHKAGFAGVLAQKNETAVDPELIIDVRNDTPNEYTLESKVTAGKLNFEGNTFSVGEVKRFTVKSIMNTKGAGLGDILFLSAPMAGSNNTTCQEVHTLNYDLKYANQFKNPLVVNLSSVASRIECK